MTPSSGRFSIRFQLLLLFGLLIATGALLLAVDEYSQYQSRRAMKQLKDESLAGQRRIKAVADAYAQDIVDVAFKVRNRLMGWEQGLNIVENAQVRIARHWDELRTMPREPQAQSLFVQTMQARVDADRVVERLRQALRERDRITLDEVCASALYPAVDPVSTRLKFLSDVAMIQAERIVKDDVARSNRYRLFRLVVAVSLLVVMVIIGRRLVRNIYRGVESLNALAGRIRQRDFEFEPRYRPKGELGSVMDTFLVMRGDILKFEMELTQSLAQNEDVRRELEERDLFQRSLLASAQTSIISTDAEDVIVHINPFAERLLGHPADGLVGRQTPALFHDTAELAEVAAELTAALDEDVQPGLEVFRRLALANATPREWTLLRRDGRRIPVLLAISPLKGDHGELNGLLFVATDLTEIKQLEVQLRDSEARARSANQAKSAFLAAMSHEIRTPMIGITGMVEILSHTRLDADQRRSLNVVQQSAASLLQIIGDILDFSKIEAGKLELAPETVDLRQLLGSVTQNYTGTASSKGLNLVHHVDDRVGAAYIADPLRLRQILSNFLSNAIKFTDKGSIEVVLEPVGSNAEGERLCFRVSDSGIGVSSEQQKRLFRPFSQADGDTTRRYGGTGLGLVICRRLADLMGAEISMESEPGRGTTMRLIVALPPGEVEDVRREDAGLAGVPAFTPRPLPSPEQAEREGSLILLVDDHPTNRLVIVRQLALAGFIAETAEDGVQGLEKWRSGRYALVLSDVHMPQLDGYQMTRALRDIEVAESRARTPVVALTAAAMKGEAERCYQAGMDDYLAKPVSIGDLVRCLHRWLPDLPDDVASAVLDDGNPPPASLAQFDQPPPLDEHALDELAGGDDATRREVLQDFLQACEGDIEAFRQAEAERDDENLGRAAHRIKGAARLVGAGELAEAAEALEQAAKGQQWNEILALKPGIDAAFARLRGHMQQRFPD
ncbi:MAG: response regulator [Xanthomonadales bacterium]|nr:response regulator [Xanthomonadales bacterium]